MIMDRDNFPNSCSHSREFAVCSISSLRKLVRTAIHPAGNTTIVKINGQLSEPNSSIVVCHHQNGTAGFCKFLQIAEDCLCRFMVEISGWLVSQY